MKKLAAKLLALFALLSMFSSPLFANYIATEPDFGWVITAMGVIFGGIMLALVARYGFRFIKSMFS